MAVADLSRDVVEERLGALEEAYSSFTINQTTLGVSQETYDRARDRCTEGVADVYVKASDGDGDVLLVERDGEWVVPSVRPPVHDPLEVGVSREFAEATGVECQVTDLDRVTILGVCHEDDLDCETVYRLVAVFTAERTGGSPNAGATWHSELPDSALPSH
jgi:ADP-ribose pyrophosphatase YjhB (NUDIX family)